MSILNRINFFHYWSYQLTIIVIIFVYTISDIDSITIDSQQNSSSSKSSEILQESTSGRIYLENGMNLPLSIQQQQSATTLTPQISSSLLPQSKMNDDDKPTNQPQFSVQIYLIIFIGFVPACLGGLAWCGMHNRCCRNKNHQCSSHQTTDFEYGNNGCNNISDKNNNFQDCNKRYNQKNITLNNMINVRRSNGIVRSRPVHSSYEVPRNSLEMLEVLGEGNFGQVWKARSHYFGNKDNTKLVAVKTNKLTENSEPQDDILKELDIMVQLGSHPNVVRLLGCCTENKPFYIVMEFVSQGKLLSYLRQHRDDYLDVINDYNSVAKSSTMMNAHYNHNHNQQQNPNRPFINNNNYMTYYHHTNNNNDGYGEINRKSFSKSMNKHLQQNENDQSLSSYDLIHFAYQISKGMEFISSHGIIHRDLAVRNILIDENKNCKVADFGLSRSIRDKDCDMYEMKHGGQVPVRWMSPEALTMGIFSIKSDVWAFGITLWEIVTLGSTPYIGMSAPEVINYIRQGNICSQPVHCNDHLYDLMKSCWAYKADDRFTFTQIKYHLMKMLLAIQENNNKDNYIDLDNFNNSLYYFNTTDPSDEKL
uniref:receptor protein-tyrosine kinase n=1 Tax=Dermatophagoides pteronyssinus TaxID=6956 RepID=A0A6P6Y475_DERPT|nr:tyrosine kinase receptor Cad96Ca-like [Dermatophagoides pteronyssinus]